MKNKHHIMVCHGGGEHFIDEKCDFCDKVLKNWENSELRNSLKRKKIRKIKRKEECDSTPKL